FNHAGDLLASTDWTGTLFLWDVRTGRLLLETPGNMLQHMLRFSPDDTRLAAQLAGDRLRVRRVAAGREGGGGMRRPGPRGAPGARGGARGGVLLPGRRRDGRRPPGRRRDAGRAGPDRPRPAGGAGGPAVAEPGRGPDAAGLPGGRELADGRLRRPAALAGPE